MVVVVVVVAVGGGSGFRSVGDENCDGSEVYAHIIFVQFVYLFGRITWHFKFSMTVCHVIFSTACIQELKCEIYSLYAPNYTQLPSRLTLLLPLHPPGGPIDVVDGS